MCVVPRNQLVKGMIFDKPGVDVLALVRKDNTNTWECEYLAGDEPDEYVRHDYIFTDATHGYRLVGFRYEDKIFWDDTIEDIQSVKDAVFQTT